MQNRSEQPVSPALQPAPEWPPYPWFAAPYPPEEEVNLLDYLRVLRKRWAMIFFLTLLIAGLAAAASFLMSKKYKAEVSMMPLTSSSSGGGLSALASQVSSLPLVGGSLSGLAGLTGNSQKTGQIISILKSRTLNEKIIQGLNLMPLLFPGRWDEATKSWRPDLFGGIPTLEAAVKKMQKQVVTIQDDKKTGLIKMQVELKDPVMAANVGNRMIVELQDFINNNQFTVAKRNRIFIEEQLQKNKMDLLEFGKKLTNFYSSNRISSVQPQLDVDVGQVIEPPKTFEEFRSNLGELQEKKQDLERKLKETESSPGIVYNVPSQVYLQFLTLQRELLGRVNALLTQQYELAKIEEAKEDLTFQVIDSAVTPIKPSQPKKLLNIAVGFIGGLFFSIFLAFFLEYLRRLRELESSKG